MASDRLVILLPTRVKVRQVLRTWAGPVMLGAAVILLLLGCIFVFPRYLVDRDVQSGASGRLDAAAQAKATNDVRTTLLQGLAGAFFLATAFFTWRQLRISQRQLQLSEDQQIAERFTRAVDQLGEKSMDVRLGGVFALEQIARASDPYRGVVAEILSAYVRQRAPWPSSEKTPATRASDVQAALTALARAAGIRGVGERPINLCSADLREADLRDAILPGVQLNNSNLADARLEDAQLEGARLVDADLRGARLDRANLRNARLINANLGGTRLVATGLWGADLTSAQVDGRTRLIKTKLAGAILRNVSLERARYGGLTSDEKTEWPEGFTPRKETGAETPGPR